MPNDDKMTPEMRAWLLELKRIVAKCPAPDLFPDGGARATLTFASASEPATAGAPWAKGVRGMAVTCTFDCRIVR